MRKIISMSLIALTLLVSTSCRKKIEASNADFIGDWSSYDTELTINANGKGSYMYDDGSLRKNINGKVKIDGSTLKISALGFSKKYNIDTRPTLDTATYGTNNLYMILDGEFFLKH